MPRKGRVYRWLPFWEGGWALPVISDDQAKLIQLITWEEFHLKVGLTWVICLYWQTFRFTPNRGWWEWREKLETSERPDHRVRPDPKGTWAISVCLVLRYQTQFLFSCEKRPELCNTHEPVAHFGSHMLRDRFAMRTCAIRNHIVTGPVVNRGFVSARARWAVRVCPDWTGWTETLDPRDLLWVRRMVWWTSTLFCFIILLNQNLFWDVCFSRCENQEDLMSLRHLLHVTQQIHFPVVSVPQQLHGRFFLADDVAFRIFVWIPLFGECIEEKSQDMFLCFFSLWTIICLCDFRSMN